MTWNVQKAAEYLDLPIKTVRALAAGHVIPGAKLGKEWRFDETTLRNWFTLKTQENVRPCRSTSAATLRIGKSSLSSLESALDAKLREQKTASPNDPNIISIAGHKSFQSKGREKRT